MDIIYCNVGKMNYYNGLNNDAIIGGGSYNEKHIGFEVNNFTNHNNMFYGYVKATNRTIDITKRYGYSKNADYAEGITVIWFAKCKIVGYYINAKVYRKPLSVPVEHALDRVYREKSVYNISSEYAVLIAPDKRDYPIRRKGRSNVWYGNDETNMKVLKYIKEIESNIYEYTLK